LCHFICGALVEDEVHVVLTRTDPAGNPIATPLLHPWNTCYFFMFAPVKPENTDTRNDVVDNNFIRNEPLFHLPVIATLFLSFVFVCTATVDLRHHVRDLALVGIPIFAACTAMKAVIGSLVAESYHRKCVAVSSGMIGDRNRRGTGRQTEWNTEYNSGRAVKALRWIFDAKLVFVVFLAIFGPAPVCARTSCHTPPLCPGSFCLGASHSPTIYTTENEFPTVTFATMKPRCPFAAAVILVFCINASVFAAPPTRPQTPWLLLQTLSESVPFTPEFFCQHSEETCAANLSVIAEHRNGARTCAHARSRQPHGDGAQFAFKPHISSVGRLGTQDLQSAPPQQVAKNIISIRITATTTTTAAVTTIITVTCKVTTAARYCVVSSAPLDDTTLDLFAACAPPTPPPLPWAPSVRTFLFFACSV
jgi:hypothetical protein